MSVADGTIVVGDYNGSDDLNPFTTLKNPDHGKGGPSKGRRSSSAPQQAKFQDAVDSIDGTRPFFIKIGTGGLLEALDKLDRELVAVRSYLAT